MKQLIKTDNYCAIEDPLLNYLVDVANHFWYSYDVYTNEVIESSLPEQFANRFFLGCINTDRKQKYLDSEEVINTLKAFKLDVDKFWYLCLAIKDFVEGFTNDGIKNKKFPRQELKELEDELNKLDKQNAILTLKISKHPIKINNPSTLSLIGKAIHNLLEENKYSDLLDSTELDLNNTITLKPIYKIALFNKYLSWFLKDKVADKVIYASKDKSLLISRMIFILGISDDESFFDEYKEDGSKLDYLKNYIKKYKDIEAPTIQSRYWM